MASYFHPSPRTIGPVHYDISGPGPRGGGGGGPPRPGPGPGRGPRPAVPAGAHFGPRHFGGRRGHGHWWGGPRNWYGPQVVYAYPYCDPYWDPYCQLPYYEISGQQQAAIGQTDPRWYQQQEQARQEQERVRAEMMARAQQQAAQDAQRRAAWEAQQAAALRAAQAQRGGYPNRSAAEVEHQRVLNMLAGQHPTVSPVHPYTMHRPGAVPEDWPIEGGVAIEGVPGCSCSGAQVGAGEPYGCIEAGAQIGEGYNREQPGWRATPMMGVWMDVGYQRPRTVGWNNMLASNELISRGPTDSLDINSLAFGQ